MKIPVISTGYLADVFGTRMFLTIILVRNIIQIS